MLRALIPALDVAISLAALASAFFWLKASRQSFRRVSRQENLDAADINRLVTALNRSQILNGRAALSTALAAGLAALRFALDLVTR